MSFCYLYQISRSFRMHLNPSFIRLSSFYPSLSHWLISLLKEEKSLVYLNAKLDDSSSSSACSVPLLDKGLSMRLPFFSILSLSLPCWLSTEPIDVVSPSRYWPASVSFPITWGPVCQFDSPSIVLPSCYMFRPSIYIQQYCLILQ